MISKMKPPHAAFAKRTGWDLHANALAELAEEFKRQGTKVLDLTESNPTQAGFAYPPEIFSLLSDPGSLTYEPTPKGLLPAREAVGRLYAAKGVEISPESILLTASTSEAYGFLFRLLANGGEEILVPVPSYPLFEYLAVLHDLKSIPYPLRYEGDRWRIEISSLKRLLSRGTRAIIAVHPNNPTGSCLTGQEKKELLLICREHGLALIADEVFAEYLHEEKPEIPKTLSGDPAILAFSLGGLSKFMGLPQMKLSWIAATGPGDLVGAAVDRLEVIADTFLSVATPVQRAFPQWMGHAASVQSQIRERLSDNLRRLRDRIRLHPKVKLLASDGGWSAVLKVEGLQDEEGFVLRLLEEQQIMVYPGYFFDFEDPGLLVFSLLAHPKEFEEGIQRLFAQL